MYFDRVPFSRIDSPLLEKSFELTLGSNALGWSEAEPKVGSSRNRARQRVLPHQKGRVSIFDRWTRISSRAHFEKDAQLLAGLQSRIMGYLALLGTVEDPAALQLLKETMELLETQKQIDDDRAKTPDLNDSLKAISSYP